MSKVPKQGWWFYLFKGRRRRDKMGAVFGLSLLAIVGCTSSPDTAANDSESSTADSVVEGAVPDSSVSGEQGDDTRTLVVAAPTTPPGLDWEFFSGHEVYDHIFNLNDGLM